MVKMKTSVTIEDYLYTWLSNNEESISQQIEDMVKEKYNKESNPFILIEKLKREEFEIATKKNRLLEKLSQIKIEGNLKEREESERILEEQRKELKENLDKLLPALKILQKHSKWKTIVNEEDEERKWEMVTELQDQGIQEARWSFVNELMKLFTKEQLLGKEKIDEEKEG